MSWKILRTGNACSLLLVLGVGSLLATDGNPDADLQRLRRWRQRDKASLIALEKLGEQLLQKYQKPEQQGEIYYHLAHQHAQGGFVFPKKAIEYARKALNCPLTPDQKMRLYVYCGDAIQVADRQKPFADKRREGVGPYLQGLKELQGFQLSDAPPHVPNAMVDPNVLPLIPQVGATEQQRLQYEEAVRKYDQAREQAEFARKMINHRRVLRGQIVALYGHRPLANEELRSIAINIIGEGKELDHLMAAVNEKITQLPPEPNKPMPALEEAPPAASSTYLYLIVILGAGAAIASVLLLLTRWRRLRHDGANSAQ